MESCYVRCFGLGWLGLFGCLDRVCAKFYLVFMMEFCLLRLWPERNYLKKAEKRLCVCVWSGRESNRESKAHVAVCLVIRGKSSPVKPSTPLLLLSPCSRQLAEYKSFCLDLQSSRWEERTVNENGKGNGASRPWWGVYKLRGRSFGKSNGPWKMLPRSSCTVRPSVTFSSQAIDWKR